MRRIPLATVFSLAFALTAAAPPTVGITHAGSSQNCPGQKKVCVIAGGRTVCYCDGPISQ